MRHSRIYLEWKLRKVGYYMNDFKILLIIGAIVLTFVAIMEFLK